MVNNTIRSERLLTISNSWPLGLECNSVQNYEILFLIKLFCFLVKKYFDCEVLDHELCRFQHCPALSKGPDVFA